MKKWIISLTAFTILCTLTMGSSCYAQDLNHQKQALDIISDFAHKICPQVTSEGSTTDLSGTAKADLGNVVSRVAGLGFDSAVKYGKSTYQGELQKDVAASLKDSNSCRLKIFESLKDKLLLGNAGSQPPPTPPTPSATCGTTDPRAISGWWINDDGRRFFINTTGTDGDVLFKSPGMKNAGGDWGVIQGRGKFQDCEVKAYYSEFDYRKETAGEPTGTLDTNGMSIVGVLKNRTTQISSPLILHRVQ